MSNDIDIWLREEGLNPQSFQPNHIRLYFEHKLAEFALDITIIGAFCSLGADLMSDVEGKNSAEFYRFLHNFNARLNGPKVTLQDGRFILLYEKWHEDLTKDNLIRDIYWFRKIHELALRTLLQEAKRLGLRFRQGQ